MSDREPAETPAALADGGSTDAIAADGGSTDAVAADGGSTDTAAADGGSTDAVAAGADADLDVDQDASDRAEAEGISAGTDTPLVVENLRKNFGGITAVDDASFEVERGSLTGLIGPNGAGKSTTFNCITGVHEVTAGHVYFEGEDITGLRPEQVCNRGLVRTFQIARELEEMTVLENMMLAPKGQVGESLIHAVTPGLREGVVEQEEELLESVWETLEFFEIDHLAQEYAGNLSGGQRKLLEMARALMTDPEMVLLDEPLAGVNPSLENKLLERIHQLKEQGHTFLLVEHDMDVIMAHCEHVIVMHQGQVLAEGTPDEVRSDERVVEAYLGGEVE